LRDPETADDTRTLLKTFRKRRDLFAGIAEEIDELVRRFGWLHVEMAVDQDGWLSGGVKPVAIYDWMPVGRHHAHVLDACGFQALISPKRISNGESGS
jgi:hypothetical protein